MSKSRIFALTGGAGTGKTTVLSIFCDAPEIRDNGVLLLAPTGKAAVRLKESMGRKWAGEERNGGIKNKEAIADFDSRIRTWRGVGPVGNQDKHNGCDNDNRFGFADIELEPNERYL